MTPPPENRWWGDPSPGIGGGVILLTIFRVAAALAFIVSGFVKLMEPYENFVAVIHRFNILSGWPAEMLAVALPWGELIFGVFLLAGLWVRFSGGALWVFSSLFLVAIVSAIVRKLPIEECGCFGESLSLPIHQMLFVDLALWLVLGLVFIFAKKAGAVGLDGRFSAR